MFDALLLDFYGTVVNEDEPILAEIRRRVSVTAAEPVTADHVGRLWSSAFAEECNIAAGDTFKTQRDAVRDSLARVLDVVGSGEDPDRLCAPQFAYWQRPSLLEDAKPFLERVGIPVCIVSDIDRDDIDAAIAHHGLVVDHVVTSEDVRAYKPRPEPFLRALDLVGVAPGAALHVGDSLSSDVAGANHLGIRVAWVNRSSRRPAEPVDLWAEVADLAELDRRLDRLRAAR